MKESKKQVIIIGTGGALYSCTDSKHFEEIQNEPHIIPVPPTSGKSHIMFSIEQERLLKVEQEMILTIQSSHKYSSEYKSGRELRRERRKIQSINKNKQKRKKR